MFPLGVLSGGVTVTRGVIVTCGITMFPARAGDAIEMSKLAAARVHDARNEGHQRFRMTAHHALRFARDDRASVRIEDGCRAGPERGVDRQNSH